MGAPCATPAFRLAVASTSQRTLRAPFARTPRRVVRALATPCPGGQDQAEARPAQQEGIPSHTRRHALLTALAAAAAAAAPPADAAQGLSKYLRKRLLDPLSAYVPPVLEARAQLERVAGVLVDDPVEARILLRSGAFEGLRDNVRAVGQYAEQAGVPGAAALVPDFFKAVQALDFELFSAVRAQTPVGPDTDARRVDAVAALDRLLDTVPDDVLATARKVVDVAAGGRVVEGGAAAATGGAGSGAGVDDLLPRVE